MPRKSLDDVNEELKELIAEVCSHAAGTKERQKKLSEIVKVVKETDYLWWENMPYYEDALQQTWLHLCKKPELYDPTRGTVVNWLNNYLKWQLSKLRQANAKTEVRRRAAIRLGRTEEMQDLIEVDNEEAESRLASPDIPKILEETRRWVQSDRSGELRKTHVEGRPDVNCQILILLRLPPEVRWKTIAKDFRLPSSTASTFYSREARPRLRKFAMEQGYLD